MQHLIFHIEEFKIFHQNVLNIHYLFSYRFWLSSLKGGLNTSFPSEYWKILFIGPLYTSSECIYRFLSKSDDKSFSYTIFTNTAKKIKLSSYSDTLVKSGRPWKIITTSVTNDEQIRLNRIISSILQKLNIMKMTKLIVKEPTLLRDKVLNNLQAIFTIK